MGSKHNKCSKMLDSPSQETGKQRLINMLKAVQKKKKKEKSAQSMKLLQEFLNIQRTLY